MLHVCVCFAVVSVPCSLVVTYWERTDFLAVGIFVFCHFPKCVLVHIKIKGEVGAVKVKYFTDSSKTVFLLWIFYVFSVLCLLYLCARLHICALWSPAGKGLTFWLSFLVFTVSLSLSHWYPGSGVVLYCIDS